MGKSQGLNSKSCILDSSKILREQILGIPSGTIKYIYSNEEVIGFVYDSSKYLYLKNLQNDIIGIVDSNGNIVAKYVYDAWGNHIVCNPNGTQNTSVWFIGNINPFRYRGYYYDVKLDYFTAILAAIIQYRKSSYNITKFNHPKNERLKTFLSKIL